MINVLFFRKASDGYRYNNTEQCPYCLKAYGYRCTNVDYVRGKALLVFQPIARESKSIDELAAWCNEDAQYAGIPPFVEMSLIGDFFEVGKWYQVGYLNEVEDKDVAYIVA